MLDTFNIKLSNQIHQMVSLGFSESLFLWKDAICVFTDSGGLQEETSGLGIPCFTIRENTERPITVEEGTNVLVGCSGKYLKKAFEDFKSGHIKKGEVPELWDGRSAEKIVDILINKNKLNTLINV